MKYPVVQWLQDIVTQLQDTGSLQMQQFET